MNTLVFLSGSDTLLSAFIIAIIIIALFLALRAIMLWYWKVNEIVHNQNQQIILLKALVRHQIGEEEYNRLFKSAVHLKPTAEEIAKSNQFDTGKA
jgi:hypothetical protein